jgi:prepilin signal peptidase PulO-like enzyme (type II secretory pathway)
MQAWINISVFLLFAVPITVFDVKEYRIPDLLTLGGILVFALMKLLLEKESIGIIAAECAVGFGVFWLIRFFSKGRMGLGDAKYSALIAVAAGFYSWFIALFIASVVGIACVVVLIRFSRMDRAQRIPFAPFLSVGALAALVLKGFFWQAALPGL